MTSFRPIVLTITDGGDNRKTRKIKVFPGDIEVIIVSRVAKAFKTLPDFIVWNLDDGIKFTGKSNPQNTESTVLTLTNFLNRFSTSGKTIRDIWKSARNAGFYLLQEEDLMSYFIVHLPEKARGAKNLRYSQENIDRWKKRYSDAQEEQKNRLGTDTPLYELIKSDKWDKNILSKFDKRKSALILDDVNFKMHFTGVEANVSLITRFNRLECSITLPWVVWKRGDARQFRETEIEQEHIVYYKVWNQLSTISQESPQTRLEAEGNSYINPPEIDTWETQIAMWDKISLGIDTADIEEYTIMSVYHEAKYHIVKMWRKKVTVDREGEFHWWISIEIPSSFSEGEYSDVWISRLGDILGERLNPKNTKQFGISGYYGIRGWNLNPVLLLSYFTSNRISQFYTTISENNRNLAVTKDSTGVGCVYNPDYPAYRSRIHFSTVERATMNDPLVQIGDITAFSEYVLVRISRVNDPFTINWLHYTLTFIITVYWTQRESIHRFYTKMGFKSEVGEIDTFFQRGKLPDRPLDRLNLALPEITTGGKYTTKCAAERQPLVVSEKEAKQKDKKRVFQYPKEDGVWLWCDKKKFPNPGFKDADDLPLDVRQRFPHYPCCFSKGMVRKKIQEFNMYYNIESQMDITDPTANKKFIARSYRRALMWREEHSHQGVPPTEIQDLLNTSIARLEPNPFSEFLRQGSPETPSSIIHCILEALEVPSYVNQSLPFRQNYLRIERNKIADQHPELTFMVTETPEWSDEDRIRYLRDSSLELSANIWSSLLNWYYKINIIAFTPDGFEYPFSQGPTLLRPWNKTWPFIMVIKSPSHKLHALYPTYELLFWQRQENERQFTFSYETIKDVRQLYHKIKTTKIEQTSSELERPKGAYILWDWFGDKEVVERRGDVLYQVSDDYGKINYAGIKEVQGFIEDVIAQCDAKGKLEFTKTKDEDSNNAPKFAVTLGVIPDYMYDGKGMMISGVREGRPAAKAGIKNGDIVIKMGDVDVTDMMAYMKALGKFKKGEKTMVTVKRGEEELEFEVEF